MGVVQMPDYRMYWQEDTHYQKNYEILKKTRFDELRDG